MVVSISVCVCVCVIYSAAAISLAWLSLFLAKHWTGPVYSTLAPIEDFTEAVQRNRPEHEFATVNGKRLLRRLKCAINRSWWCRALPFFSPNPNSDRVGSSWPVGYGTWSRTMRWGDWRGRAAWIHMGTGQDRQAGSACHSTAEGRDGSRRF